MDEYKFKIYVKGNIIHETGVLNLKEAQRFYMVNYSPEIAMRLFVNGEQISYLNTAKVLQITRSEYLNTVKPLLPHTVRG